MQGNVLIDYLKAVFVLPELSNVIYPSDCEFYKTLINILGYDKEYIETTKGGLFGYRLTTTIGEHIRIMLTGPKNGDGEHTHLLEMTGRACRDFEDNGGDWRVLLDFLVMNGCNITRIDIANDLINYDLFNIQDLIKKIEKDEYITPRFNKKTITKSDKVNSTDNPGVSITFGSRLSEAVLQIYDKKAEQKAKNISVSCSKWIRFELRYYKTKALIFILEYLKRTDDEIPTLFASVLADSISFLVPQEENNEMWTIVLDKRSWKVCKWWNNHIGNVEKLKIQNQAILESTILTQVNWLETSVAKVLMRVSASYGKVEFIKLLNRLLTTKLSDLSSKDLAIVNSYRSLDNTKELTYSELINEIETISEELITEVSK